MFPPLRRALSVLAPAALLAAAALVAPAPGAAQHRTAAAAGAETRPQMLVVTRALRPGELIGPGDVALTPGKAPPGALTDPEQAIGKETKIALYPRRPVPAGALGAPTLVARNAIVRLSFALGALRIEAEGRALDAGGLGERIRVMNLDSRQTVYGTIAGPAEVVVQ